MPRDTYDMFKDPERGRFGDNEQRDERRDQFAGLGHDIQHKAKGREISLALIWHRESENAALFSHGDSTRGVWLPKSLIRIEWRGEPYKDRRGNVGRGCNVTLPEWKAKQENLI